MFDVSVGFLRHRGLGWNGQGSGCDLRMKSSYGADCEIIMSFSPIVCLFLRSSTQQATSFR